MILDFLNEFANDEAVAGAAATRNVGDVIDLMQVAGGDLGHVPPIYWYVLVNAAPTGATTVEFKLVSDDGATPAVDGSATQHLTTGAVAIASLPAGTLLQFALPHENLGEYERYLGLQVTNVGASALAALNITSGLTLTPRRPKLFPEGNN